MVSGILSKVIARIQSPEAPPRRWLYGGIAAILALAAGLRLFRRFLEPFPARDAIWYTQIAEEIARSSWREALEANPGLFEFYPPLMFIVMSSGERWGIGAENMGWILVLTTGVLLPAALALIAWELFADWRYAMGALLLGAIMPPAVRMSAELLRESPYWCFCAFSLLFAIRGAAGKGWWNWGIFAVFGSLAVLTRREGMEILAVFLIFQAIWGWKQDRFLRVLRRKILTVAGVVAVFLLVLLPVEYVLRQQGFRWESFPWESIGYIFHRRLFG